MGILKSKEKVKTKTLSVRIEATLHADLEKLKSDAEAKNMLFDVSEVVEKALAVAIRAARTELETASK